jgi:hypothetical protein
MSSSQAANQNSSESGDGKETGKSGRSKAGAVRGGIVGFFRAALTVLAPLAPPADTSALTSLCMAVILIYLMVTGQFTWAWVTLALWVLFVAAVRIWAIPANDAAAAKVLNNTLPTVGQLENRLNILKQQPPGETLTGGN